MEKQDTKTKTIVVGVNHTTDELFNYQLQELIALCEARDIEVVDSLIQNLPHPNNATYLGSGKLEELKNLKDIYDAELIVFIEELSPIQLRNIGNYLDVEIIDRTMLILEIFETRAKTIEAKLQVEIANLKYMLPRLVGSYVHLSRTGGGGGGGAGARRGSGETKLEEDRRHIERRIYKASDELEKVVIARKTSRKSRASNEIKTVAFVGYTNAGKSSTMNTLLTMFDKEAEKQVFVKDMLFATLETSTRAIKLPTNEEFLITDTVGFVSNLPHHLIDVCSPKEQFGSGDFVRLADIACKDIFSRGKIPVVCGGTAFYIKNFIYGLHITPTADEKTRSLLQEKMKTYGAQVLFKNTHKR